MNRSDIRCALVDELINVAPDIDPDIVTDGDHLQDDLELDSMDILNLVTGLHERLGVQIPESDYRKIETIGAAVNYLFGRRQVQAD